MIGPLGFLVVCSVRNFVRYRLSRLRQPRYLVATLLGALYFGSFALRQVGRLGHHRYAQTSIGMIDSEWVRYHEVLLFCASVVLLLIAVASWLVPNGASTMKFSQAEVQFLFAAPIRRRSLIHFKILKSQLALLLGVMFATLGLRGQLFKLSSWPTIAGGWVIFATLHSYFLAQSLARASLAQNGLSAVRRRVLELGVVALVLGMFVSGVLQALPAVSAAVMSAGQEGFATAMEAVLVASRQGLLHWVLLPTSLLARPLLARDGAEFVRAMGPAMGFFLLAYFWAVGSEASFEEESFEASERAAKRVESRRARRGRGSRVALASRAVPFKLAPTGRPEVAILWKQLIASGRALTRRTPLYVALWLALVGVSMALFARVMPSWLPGVMALPFLAIAGVQIGFGPMIHRHDFRCDLLDSEAMKCYPIPGAAMVWGEILGPVVTLTVIQWGCVLTMLVLNPWIELPNLGVGTRTWILSAVLLLLPGVNLVTVLIQNGFTLLLPGWMPLGPERERGLERIGFQMLNILVTGLCFVAASLAPGMAALLTVLLGMRFIGPASYVLAAVGALALYAAEVWVASRILARTWEQLDPVQAGVLRSA